MKRLYTYLILFSLSVFTQSAVAADDLAKIKEKLAITIPKVKFEKQTLEFAVEFIKRISRDLDLDGVGINIVLAVEDKGKDKKLINLDADNMSIAELIKTICSMHGLNYKVEKHAVLIGSHTKLQIMETKFYVVSSTFVGLVSQLKPEDDKDAFQNFFELMGVRFPPGAKMVYVKSVLRLVITNTPEQHKKVNEIMRQIGAPYHK